MTKRRKSRRNAPQHSHEKFPPIWENGQGIIWPSVLKYAMVFAIWGVVLVTAILLFFAIDLPDISKNKSWARPPSVTILSEDGNVVARVGQTSGQTIKAKDLPEHVVQAVLATEDRRFYYHLGIDPLGMLRAMVVNTVAGDIVQGGSTITQQLAKNMFLSPQQTFKRKIQEMMLAVWLDAKYTKDEILTAYLNNMYLGAGNYGISAASEYYFNKTPRDLNLREAAIIAGLLKAPSRFAPTTSPARAEDRADTVLGAMVDEGFITEKEREAALSIPMPPRRKPGSGDAVYYFADYVKDQANDILGTINRDIIVQTTLNFRQQQLAEQQMEFILSGDDAKRQNVSQSALVAMTPDGAIRAMVGGMNYHEAPFNRAVQAIRQPGSSFKPIVYLAALEAGLTPDSMVEDAPISFGTWSPGNYDGEYRGELPLREALAYSLNTVAVRILQYAGIDRAITLARQMGITSNIEPNLSIALGSSGLSPLELTTAYATIANQGRLVRTHAILEIHDDQGKQLFKREEEAPEQIIDAGKIAELTSMMTGVIQYGTGTGANIGRPQAGKTGTSSDFKDAWFMGFTPDLVAGVWMGNDDNEPMKKVTGGGLPARLWAGFMRGALANVPPTPLSISYSEMPTEIRDSSQSTGVLTDPREQNAQTPRRSFDEIIANPTGVQTTPAEPAPAQ